MLERQTITTFKNLNFGFFFRTFSSFFLPSKHRFRLIFLTIQYSNIFSTNILNTNILTHFFNTQFFQDEKLSKKVKFS